MGKIKLWLKIVDDKTGKVEIDRESHSWVINFPSLLVSIMTTTYNESFDTIKTTSGSSGAYLAQNDTYKFGVVAAAGTVSYGIVVGTGTTAESSTQYVLTTPVAHGAGSGQLSYGVVTLTEATTSGTTAYFTIARTLTNSYASTDLVVKEIAIYVRTGTTYYIMIARDLETFTVTKAGGTKTVTYTITVDNTG